MGGQESKYSREDDILCPHCPLTPIINIFMNDNNVLTCEYRCPKLHFGYIPFSELFKYKDIHGNECNKCNKNFKELEKELLYCGTCKQYLCSNCIPKHSKEKESHKVLIKKSRVNYTCLEHNKSFDGYCFSCLMDKCPECSKHNKHVVKKFEEIRSVENLEDFQYILNGYKNYINNFKRQVHYNKLLFEEFKKRNENLLAFIKYLNDHLEFRTQENTLNSEVIINYLNIREFDYEVPKRVYENANDFEKYCKNHLILKFRPISYICNFSRNKQDFNISRLELKAHHSFDSETPKYFKYSPIGGHIIFASGSSIYLLSTKIKENINKIESEENKEKKTKKKNKEKKDKKDKKEDEIVENERNKKELVKTDLIKITFEENIFSFNIINKNILCIFINDKKNIYLYKLISIHPYYSEDDTLPKIELPLTQRFKQILGNFNKILVTRAGDGIINLHKFKNGRFEVVFSNKDEKEKGNDDNLELKGIWNDYLVIRNGENIIIRELLKKELNIFKIKNIFKDKSEKRDLLVYNGNIITFYKNNMFFLNIPNLDVVSVLELMDNISSINIINPRTMIVVENDYIEQLEVNTWKRLWWKANFGESKQFVNLLPIGTDNKLFIYNKKNNIFYYTS